MASGRNELLFLGDLHGVICHVGRAPGLAGRLVGARQDNGVFENLRPVADPRRCSAGACHGFVALDVSVVSRCAQSVSLPFMVGVLCLGLGAGTVEWGFFRGDIINDIGKVLTNADGIIRGKGVQLCYRQALYPAFLRFPASSDYIFTVRCDALVAFGRCVPLKLEATPVGALMARLAQGNSVVQIIAK